MLFDCDGVLVDSEGLSARSTAVVLQAIGLDIDAPTVLRRFMGTSDKSMCEALKAETGITFPPDIQHRLDEAALELSARELQAMPGIARLLESLTLPRCVASSSTPERIQRSLELTGLWPLLHHYVFSATMVQNGKPAPDLFLHAAGAMGATPARCLVIEDSTAGVRAGKAAGMTVWGFLGGTHVEPAAHGAKLQDLGADRLFGHMDEVHQALSTGQ
ncbi:MAG: HAD family hydrolase [Geminicoccaceae bacterium]|nr:MAG: HAD family hydrolase [Geminicoccaceae bacterium]